MRFSNLFRKKTVQDILNQVAKNEADGHQALGKHLTARDLTAFGIAAIIGAGIFSTIGKASADGGPGVIFLFIFTAIACSFAAFAYAEFASMVPVSGSAYTYSYVAFGEIIAWIIGWGINYGICHRKHYCCYILERLLYRLTGKRWHTFAPMGADGLPHCFKWF